VWTSQTSYNRDCCTGPDIETQEKAEDMNSEALENVACVRMSWPDSNGWQALKSFAHFIMCFMCENALQAS